MLKIVIVFLVTIPQTIFAIQFFPLIRHPLYVTLIPLSFILQEFRIQLHFEVLRAY